MTTFRHRACLKKQGNVFEKIVCLYYIVFCLFVFFVCCYFVVLCYASLLYCFFVACWDNTDLPRGLQVIGSMPIAFIAVAPTGKASFVYDYVQTRLVGQDNGKWPFSLVYVLKPLIAVIKAILMSVRCPLTHGLNFSITLKERSFI